MIFILEFVGPDQLSSTIWDKNTTNVLWSPGEDIKVDGVPVNNYIYNIELKKQINHADSLTFTLTNEHPFYNSFQPQTALGTTVGLRQLGGKLFYFYGRAVTIDSGGMGIKTITCEGALAFYNDILLRPVLFATTEDPTNTYTWHDYVRFITNKFHTRMTDKQCYRRDVVLGDDVTLIHVENQAESVDITESTRYSSVDDYKTVMDALNDLVAVDSRIMMWVTSSIVSDHVQNSLFITTGFTDNAKAVMALDKNIVDVSPSGNAFDMYSAIIPLDKNKLCLDLKITTSKVDAHETEIGYEAEDMVFNTFGDIGYIEKVVTLSEYELNGDGDDDRTERDAMQARALAILKQSNTRAVSEYSVKMVDLALLTDVEREPFTAHTPVDNLKRMTKTVEGQTVVVDVIGRTSQSLQQLITQRISPIEMMWMYTNDPDVITGKCSYTPSLGDWVLSGCNIYEFVEGLDQYDNTIYKWNKVPQDQNLFIPVTTTPINLKPSQNPIYVNFERYEAKEGDRVVYDDYQGGHVYEYRKLTNPTRYRWVEIRIAIDLNQRVTAGGGETYVYCDASTFIDIAHRVHFECPELGITGNDFYHPWICTSLSMTVDNQAASSYTFSKVDETYIPADNAELSELAEAISGQIRKRKEKASTSTSYLSEAQPISVVKVDDNHVIEFYPDREVHYEAEGEGDVRNYIKSYNMPFGTTDPLDPFPSNNNNS